MDLHTTFGEGRQTKTIPICYLVVDGNTFYNMLLGRPSLNSLGAIVSTPHLAFPSTSGHILTINDDQRAARECYMASLELPTPFPPMTNNIEKITHQATTTLQAADLDPRINSESRIEPVGETKPLPLGQPDH